MVDTWGGARARLVAARLRWRYADVRGADNYTLLCGCAGLYGCGRWRAPLEFGGKRTISKDNTLVHIEGLFKALFFSR